MQNEEMIRKHVHSTVLTTLFEIQRGKVGKYSEIERSDLGKSLNEAFPKHIRYYLFSGSNDILEKPKDVSPFKEIIQNTI